MQKPQDQPLDGYRSINALAETVDGYYRAELIYGPDRPGPWKTVEDVELATLSSVHWHNTARLHGYLGDLPPTEFEATSYASERTDQELVEIQLPEPLREPGRFSEPTVVPLFVGKIPFLVAKGWQSC